MLKTLEDFCKSLNKDTRVIAIFTDDMVEDILLCEDIELDTRSMNELFEKLFWEEDLDQACIDFREKLRESILNILEEDEIKEDIEDVLLEIELELGSELLPDEREIIVKKVKEADLVNKSKKLQRSFLKDYIDSIVYVMEKDNVIC